MSFNVLICDDSALARKMAKRSLPDCFAQNTYEVNNGLDALEVMACHDIDLLLLDLTMPVLDGIGVLEEMKKRSLKTFVIVISGDIQPLMQEKVMALSALDFIQKPVKKEVLLDVLQRFGFIAPEFENEAVVG